MKIPLANGKHYKTASKIAELFAFLAIVAWFYSFYVYYQYDASAPARPDAALGRVYEQNEHGHIVYLTKDEDWRVKRMRLLTLALFSLGFTIYGLFVENPFREKAPWEKKQW